MGPNLRHAIQTLLNQSVSRVLYLEHEHRYYIICRIDDLETDLQALLDNQALLAMTDSDYTWVGANVIAFAAKEHAALFHLCA